MTLFVVLKKAGLFMAGSFMAGLSAALLLISAPAPYA
jgi:hypothetical protein